MKSLTKRRDSAVARRSINQQKTLVLNLGVVNFTSKPFKDMNINHCINHLIYGSSINKITKGGAGKTHHVFFYIFEDDLTQLQWISHNKPLRDSRIDLKTVTSITEIPTVAKKKRIDRYDPILLLSIHYGANEELLLLFEDEKRKKEWWFGLQYFVEKAQLGQDQVKETTNALAQEIFARADSDGNRTLNKNEIRQIFKDLQVYMKAKQINDTFDKYDVNKNGKIDFDEFKVLVKEKIRKYELIPIFREYTNGWVEEDYDRPAMTLLELLRFFQKEQKQDLILQEIRKFHESFEHVDSTKPCISFDLFADLMFSLLNTIFNPEFSVEYQEMTKPLTDYYVNSSHNTYLMANQLTGESSVHAYINALLKGCRCMELDLWNGPNSEPIIYHGHTMTSKILFKDVIVALKEHAFKTNPYPIIMSFEMHCDLRSQQRVVDILKTEIGDMIYVIPEDFNRQDYYPSPASLKNKFIIKGKGKLLQKEERKRFTVVKHQDIHLALIEKAKQGIEQPKQEEQEERDETFHLSVIDSSFDSQIDPLENSPTKNHMDTMLYEEATPVRSRHFRNDEDDDNLFAKMKNTNLNSTLLSRNHLTIHRFSKEESTDWAFPTMSYQASGNLFRGKKNTEDEKLDESIDDCDTQRVSARMITLNVNQYFVNRPGYSVRLLSASNNEKNNEASTVSPTLDTALNGSVNHIKNNTQNRQLQKPKGKTLKVLPELNNLYSMIGKKMDFNPGRKIWEISSLHEGKIAKLYKNRHKQIVDFHKKFLTRIYPTASRIDSSNYDPTTAWATGSQLVALNFQTTDEAMLVNYAKFMANGGVGYVLKPRYLRHNTLHEQDLACYPRDMKKPIKKLKIKIISGQQIRPDKYKSKEIIDPYVEIKIRGLEIDEQNNTTFRTQTIKDNGFRPIWSTKSNPNVFEFKICAPDFCTLVFHVYDEDMVGRDKIGWYTIEFNNIQQGYRVIPVLNTRFLPINHSYVFCHVSIENL